ncbi:peptidase M28 [Bradyrhizobium sp. CCBAU 45389]|nr:peptidase M28 [Bradyrhizobium sp. CCBAU 45389]
MYPICRSITGDGVRRTIDLIRNYIPLTTCEVPSGLQVFDWTVPPEWNVRDAYIKNSAGERVVDFKRSNLHLLNYSVPVRARMTLDELKPHLYTDPEKPDWIPYRTSYYKATWGFCLPHNQLLAMREDDYEVCVDASLGPGHLTYGELRVPGRTSEEVLISCHICHPSMCNDNLSGIAVATALAQHLCNMEPRYTYRFLFVPGTIGSITWLALNEARVGRVKHGFVLTCVGDPGPMTYKRSRRGNTEIDRAWSYVLEQCADPHEIQDFSPYGYDERQYCSPGFDLPIGTVMRTPFGKFAEYHSSADNLDFVRPDALRDTLSKVIATIDIIENNMYYRSVKPFCEPRLGIYGLYSGLGGLAAGDFQLALLWVLNMSDGENSLLDIAERARLSWGTIKKAAVALSEAGLIRSS